MLMDTTDLLPGRRKFLEQRAILQNSLTLTRANNTATRFDRLDETRKKVIFMLANEAASRIAGMPQLTRRHLDAPFASLGEAEQAVLLLGIKRLAEFAAALPWEFEDYAAPRAEIQAIRDKPPTPDNAVN